ncbi:MAG: nucleoside recognition protein [Gemmatimonadetes bacterium]|nr:nucleoside recognition protein [Gemmatimonadota bacterium]
MLNYIWAGLIVSSFLFAAVRDVGDLRSDRYRNDQPLAVELAFPDGYDPAARQVAAEIRIDPSAFAAFYGTSAPANGSYPGTLVQTVEGRQLRFDLGVALPEPLATIQGVSQSGEGKLQGELLDFTPPPGQPLSVIPADVVFQPVRFVAMTAISAAALDFAETAATIALGLIGVLAIFLGLLKIGEEAGVIHAIVKLVRPVLRPLFPQVPADHPALAMIALNITANMFGLGNAATPFGIKAMEELQKLNPTDDTATDPMVMLLAINTASVQIVPPVLLLALMGLQVNELIFAILLTTGLSLLVAIVAAKLYGRLPRFRASDPNRGGAVGTAPGAPAAPSVSAGPGR